MQRDAIKIKIEPGCEDNVSAVATSIWEELMKYGKIWDIEQAHLLHMFFEQCGVDTERETLFYNGKSRPLMEEIRKDILGIFGMASAFDMISDKAAEDNELLNAAKLTGAQIRCATIEILEKFNKKQKTVRVTYENLHFRMKKQEKDFILMSTDITTVAQAIKQAPINENDFLSDYEFILSPTSEMTGMWVSPNDPNYIAFIFSYDVLD